MLCKKCGNSSSMVIEDMETGHQEPIDTCSECMVFSVIRPLSEQEIIEMKNTFDSLKRKLVVIDG